MTDFSLDYAGLREQLATPLLAPLLARVPVDLASAAKHGDLARWLAALRALPAIVPADFDLKDGVRIGAADQLSAAERQQLRDVLMQLHPWRKGPFELFGLHIDTEWRSDWKWDRLAAQISPLPGRTVLDVGCGNGYHCWRMAGAGAKLALGIDPHLLFNLQYHALRHFLRDPPVWVLPLALEDMPAAMQAFDTVFSMGVLYHRRSPFDHLLALKDCLRPGGELVLETLVIEGGDGQTLVPEGRYARMNNVWFLPTCNTLASWLVKSGYTAVRLLDITATSVAEQRSTSWMTFESLPEALDATRPGYTVEGYPAPVRAIFAACKAF